MLRRTCALYVVIFLVAFGVYVGIIKLFANVDLTGTLLLSGLCAIFMLLFLANTVLGTVQRGKDIASLKRAEQNEPFMDGQQEAAIGTVQPLGETLTSPLGKLPCVAYSYEINHQETRTYRTGSGSDSHSETETKKVTDYSGFGRVPMVIKTGRGDVRLYGTLTLEMFRNKLNQQQAAANAEQYVATTSFSQEKLTEAFAKAGEIANNEDETQCEDHAPSENGLLENSRYEEEVLSAGQPITALGYYSAEKGGFIPHWTGSVSGGVVTRLFPGDSRAARKAITGNQIFGIVVTGIGMLATHIFLILAILRS